MVDEAKMSGPTARILERVAASLADLEDLELLLLVGSRARADAHSESDWDFAYLAGPALDPAELLRRITLAVGTDRVDLADLRNAGMVFRSRSAADGVRVVGTRDAYERFVVDATLTYLDMEPVLREAYASVLREFDR